jgi:hypothetical protein
MGNTVIHPLASASSFPGYEGTEQTDPAAFTAASSANPNEAHNRQPMNREILAHQALLLQGLGCLRVRNNTGGNLAAGTLVRVSGLAGVVEEGDAAAQCSAWAIYGATLRNTSMGRLYWVLTDTAGTRTVNIYSRKNHDTVANGYFSAGNLVASGSRSGDGAITLTEQNSSGITGAVTVAYTVDDSDQANILHVYVFDIVAATSATVDTFAQFVLREAIADGAMGYAFTHDILTGVDTSSCSAAGARVYLGTAGAWSAAAGTYKQDVGICLLKDATYGVLLLAPGGLNSLLYAGGISLAMLVDATAQGKILGRSTAGSGDFEEVAVDGTTLEFPAGGAIQVKDGGVTAAKLADAVADEILTASLAVGAEGGSSDISVTIQIKDAQGNSLSKEILIEAWVADGTTGWECTTAPNGGVTVTTGVAADVPTADKRLRCVTNTSGQAVIQLIDSGTPTYYLRVSVGGKVYTSAAITFA